MNDVQISASEVKILVIDDNAVSLDFLTEVLSDQGYVVHPLPDGSQAFSSAVTQLPDLILLDIMLPDIDGYQICKQLKSDERTCDIPIIFISALDQVLDKVKAFSLGGVDYITKPFEAKEILVRVKTHLDIRNLQKSLQEKNIQLRQEIAERKQAEEELQRLYQQLQEANASKDTFFSIISHDLKSPFNALLGFAQLLSEYIDRYSHDEIKEKIYRLRTSAERLHALLENLLAWSRFQRGIMEYDPKLIDIREIVVENMELFTPKADQKQIALRHSIEEKTFVYADSTMTDTIIRNLISNALKFTHTGGSIVIAATPKTNAVELSVKDTGIGMSPEEISNVFRIDIKHIKEGTEGEKGTGLGLILCKELVEQNRGNIWIESEVDQGATFRFTLPKIPENN